MVSEIIKPVFVLIPIVVLAAIAGLAMTVMKKDDADDSGARFRAKRQLLTPSEQELYRKLLAALPEQVVLAQVAFSQLLTVDGGNSHENFSKFARGKQKVADFVVCAKDFKVLAVIELDDSTHTHAKDEKKDAILREAGVRIVRWNVRKMPAGDEIRSAVLA